MNDFLAMGGYALYVWPSYGLASVVLIWNVWSALRAHRDAKARAERALAMAAADAAARKT
jgi:heme exporter protein CcmD